MRKTLAGAALVLTLGLTAACGSDDSDPADPKPSASATPSAPTTEAAWSADAKPQRPQDEQSEAGAQAFAEFAADTVFYMMATSDVPALTAIADVAACETCQGWVDNYDNGQINKQSILTGPVEYRLAEKPTITDDVFYQVKLTLDVPKGKSVVTQDDGTKKGETIKAAKGLPFKADIQWKDDQWLLLRYDLG